MKSFGSAAAAGGGGTAGDRANTSSSSNSSSSSYPRDELDMMGFVDFVLAWDHRNHPAALAYFFPIFDLQHKVSHGYGPFQSKCYCHFEGYIGFSFDQVWLRV